MSRATRQETFIRSMIEGLCLTLQKYYQGQARQKPKLQAVGSIMEGIEQLWQAFPIQLSTREGKRVIDVIKWFETEQEKDPDMSRPEAIIAMTMGLAERLKVVTKDEKQAVVTSLTQEIQALYDTFDRQGRKLDLIIKGGEFCDSILRREI